MSKPPKVQTKKECNNIPQVVSFPPRAGVLFNGRKRSFQVLLLALLRGKASGSASMDMQFPYLRDTWGVSFHQATSAACKKKASSTGCIQNPSATRIKTQGVVAFSTAPTTPMFPIHIILNDCIRLSTVYHAHICPWYKPVSITDNSTTNRQMCFASWPTVELNCQMLI